MIDEEGRALVRKKWVAQPQAPRGEAVNEHGGASAAATQVHVAQYGRRVAPEPDPDPCSRPGGFLEAPHRNRRRGRAQGQQPSRSPENETRLRVEQHRAEM